MVQVKYAMFTLMLFISLLLTGRLCAVFANDENVMLSECTSNMFESCFAEEAHNFDTFRDVYEIMNLKCCFVDTATIVNKIIHLLAVENIDTSYSAAEQWVFKTAFHIAMDPIVWCNDIENIMAKRMRMSKTKNVKRYYNYAQILISKSSNWYYYALDVYNTKDTVEVGERNSAFVSIVDRFKECKNPAELTKAETVLFYALNEEYYYFKTYDSFLCIVSESYKKSLQRKLIVDKAETKYWNEKNKSGWGQYFTYLTNAKTYLATIKDHSNYFPPLEIEKVESK